MQKKYLTLLIILIFSACGHKQNSSKQNNILTFNIFLLPSFDEKAEIVLTKIDTELTIQFLLTDRAFPDRFNDTFYLKKISLTKAQFDKFDSLVIQKTKIHQPLQWTGCCDGMPVSFMLINGTDSSILHFRSPDINQPDSSGYQITKTTIDQLEILYKDSVITDYLNDVESYMDTTKKPINSKENRPINRLRKIEYGR